MKIMGPPTASRTKVLNVLGSGMARFDFNDFMFPELWDAGLFYGVDPVVMVAQSYKETGGGAFGGNVQPWFFNPCGLKIRNTTEVKTLLKTTNDDHPLLHAQFTSWRAGAIAHAQHLRAYAGVYLPADALILSPRYPLVVQINKPVAIVEWLSGRWAPSSTYGQEIVDIAKRLGAVL